MPTTETWVLRPEVLESPAYATAARAELEDEATATVLPELRRFLMEVEQEALLASTSPVLLAAGIPEPFSLARVLRSWGERVVRPVLDWFTTRLGGVEDEFLSGVLARVGESAIPRDIYRDVRSALLKAHEQSWSRTRLREELEAATAPTTAAVRATAERVVRTEVTTYFNHEVLNELKRRGFVGKCWVSYHDDRVRPTHLEANGQTVPLEAAFTVGGSRMQVPGDPAAPIGETANCRCVIYGQKDTGALVPGGWL